MNKTITDVLATKTLEELQRPVSVAAKSAPKFTKAKVEEAFGLLLDVEANNGLVSIAQEVGLTTGQIKEIHEAMRAREAELTPVEEEGV